MDFRLKRKEWTLLRRDGGLAQLGERLPCKQEVSGSIPLISTSRKKRLVKRKPREAGFRLNFQPSEAVENLKGTTTERMTFDACVERKNAESVVTPTRANSSAG